MLQARALGARALLLDVTGNNGGDVAAGYTLLASLFPSKCLQGVWQRYITVVAGGLEQGATRLPMVRLGAV